MSDNSSFSLLQHHLHFSEVTSTNNVAKQLLDENLAYQGYVISSDFQSKGRGQEGNRWEAEKGKNILCSLVLHPQLTVEYQVYLNISMCLAVYDFVKKECETAEVRIKWPNDIYVNEQKVAGILIENSVLGMTIKHSIVGVGINMNQLQFFTEKAISLGLVTGKQYSIEESMKGLLQCMELRYDQLLAGAYPQLWEQYHEFFYRRNKATAFAAFDRNFEGMPIGIDDAGRLLVNEDDEIKLFNVKEITWLQ